jgi:hypothetical protein
MPNDTLRLGISHRRLAFEILHPELVPELATV